MRTLQNPLEFASLQKISKNVNSIVMWCNPASGNAPECLAKKVAKNQTIRHGPIGCGLWTLTTFRSNRIQTLEANIEAVHEHQYSGGKSIKYHLSKIVFFGDLGSENVHVLCNLNLTSFQNFSHHLPCFHMLALTFVVLP